MRVNKIIVQIDGLPTEVDAVEWGTDPDGIEAHVRAARAEASDLTGLFEPDPDLDYDLLAETFGANGSAEVPDAGE